MRRTFRRMAVRRKTMMGTLNRTTVKRKAMRTFRRTAVRWKSVRIIPRKMTNEDEDNDEEI